MRPVTESPKETRPDSINEQLPSPDEDADTTVPYVSSTVTEPSSVKTERVTITRPVTRPVKSETTKKVTVATRPTETTTQKKLTTFVPSAREEITTATEKIPYTERKLQWRGFLRLNKKLQLREYPLNVKEVPQLSIMCTL
jgi:hypothetical protein